ncbi:MAG: hypothetical protein ACFFCS_06150 [Candidatus Hodarchaeota archaeon]
MQIVGKVRWGFWFAFGVTAGLTALLIMLQFEHLYYESGIVDSDLVMTHLAIAGIVGGFIGGLVSHEPKRGFFSALILIIVIFGTLATLFFLDFTIGNSFNVVTRYYQNLFGDVGPGVTGIYMPGYTALFWFLPGILLSGELIPMSMIGGYFSRKYVKIKPKTKVKVKGPRKSLQQIFSKPLFLLIFILAWLPVVSPLFVQDENVYKEFSAWNAEPDGTDQFRSMIEDNGYTNIQSCITSYSLLSRIEEPFVLIVLGPNRFYNPVVDLPSAMRLMGNNGSMLIAHDHGTTNYLMWWMYLASVPIFQAGEATSTFPFMLFTDGTLRDNASYHMENSFPVIENFDVHPTTTGVSKLVLNHASGLFPLIGWTSIGFSSPAYSWMDMPESDYPEGNGYYEESVDYYKLNYDSILNALGIFLDWFNIDDLMDTVIGQDDFPIGNVSLSELLDTEIPLGGLPLPVVSVSEFGNGSRVMCTSDASMFTNQLINLPGYDNAQFAINAINWLAKGNKSTPIIFDEAHLSIPGQQDMSAPAIYGQYLDYVGWLSSNWFIAPFYPFFALSSIKKWMPKSEEQKRKEQLKRKRKQEKKEERLKRRMKQKRRIMRKVEYRKESKRKTTKFTQKRIEGVLRKSTYFVQKLNWYLEQSEYNRALELLFNRVKRLIGKTLGEGATTDDVIHTIMEKDPTHDHKELTSFFERMERIMKKKGPGRLRIWRQEQFEKIYFEMIGVQQHLEEI